MKNKKFRRELVYIGIILVLIINISYAYIRIEMNHKNELKAYATSGEINETFVQGSQPEGEVLKTVSFKNSGNSAVFLRITYIESWEKNENNGMCILNNSINGKDIATKNWSDKFLNPQLWEKKDDGWYYYKRVLMPGESTDNIINSVTFPEYIGDYHEYSDSNYSLYFRMETVQASVSETTLNRDIVNSDATNTVFRKKATIDQNGVVQWQ